MRQKLDQTDGKKIWEHFQRFAEYSDLKDLYNKCIPPLAKFEQKLIDYESEYVKITQVVARFDENLFKKASKQ
jgi:hypothetical protein